MSKNITRKSIALGAASALVVTGFAGLPANAAGLADTSFVSLAPSAGTEYAVLADDTSTGAIFTLRANEAVTVSTGDLKFLVTDTSGLVEPTVASTTGNLAASVDDNMAIVLDSTNDRFTLTDADLAALLETGDVVKFGGAVQVDGTYTDSASAASLATAITVAAANTAYVVHAVSGSNVTIQTLVDISTLSLAGTLASDGVTAAASAPVLADYDAVAGLETIDIVRNKRDTVTNTYVVDTVSSSAANNEDLVLQSDSLLTRSVKVTAWMDANDNDKIDSTEYTSPERTVTWIKASEVVASTTLTYPTPGDTSVTATVTLTPNLNEQQDMAAGDIKIGFTRPGSTATVAANATQNDVTRVWSATQSLVTGNWAGMPHVHALTKVEDNGSNTMKLTAATGDFSIGDFVLVDGTKSSLNNVTTAADAITGTADKAIVLNDSDFPNSEAAEAAETGYVRAVSLELNGVSATTTALTFITESEHGLSIGDIVTTDASNTTNTSQFDVTEGVVASVPTSKSFTIAGTGFTAVTPATTDDTGDVTYVSFVEAVAGSYTAKAQVSSVAQGNTATNFAVATTSHDVTLATTATANVQGASNDDATTADLAYVRKGELSVELTATVVDKDDVAVTAGRPVVVTLGALDTGSVASVGTYTINGTAYASAVTLLTDANGKVTFTVGENDGAVGSKVEVTVAPENLTGAQTADIELTWANAVYGIYDLNDSADLATTGNNSIVAGGNYAYSLAVLDQWKNAPTDGTHRVKYATTNRTVATNYVTLTNGRGTYNVADGAISGQTNIQTVFSLEELQTDGTWNAGETLLQTGTTLTYTTSVVAATQVDAVLLDTDGSTAYGNAVADLSDAATTVALAAQDRRTSNLTRPVYGSEVIVSGRVSNATTNVPRAGAIVTLTGPNSILFSEGSVDALGGVTVKTDANGEFSVELFSNTAQTATVITVTSGADSETVKVSFTGSGASFGTSIAIDAPSTVAPGTSFKVTATLRDKNGNAVLSTTGDRMKVEYSGPGIVIAAMPTDTNTLGQVSFTVLLGTNDKGTGVVTVSYDQGDDGDFTGTATGDKDVVATASILVGTAAASSDQKVNAGSFKGYVALYAKGYAGQRMSAKVGNDWVVVPVLASNFERVVEFTGAGYTVAVRIYIDRVLIDTITVTTK